MLSLGSIGYALRSLTRSARYFSLASLLLLIAGCGGGGDGGSTLGVANPTYTSNSYSSASSYAAHCAAPRSGTSDVLGTTTWENFWLRSWTHQYYLWYSEVPDLNPASYSTTAAYFDLMKTSATTASGKAKDPNEFHFTYDTAQWIALSQSGVSAGYGVEWTVTAAAPPRVVVAAYTNPSTPASAVNIARGSRVLAVDGVDIVNGNITAWPEGLFQVGIGEAHTFLIQDLNNTQRTVTMTAANTTETPVLNYASPGVIPTSSGNVGYLIFNDHIATAESELIQAFTSLKNTGVTDLVLDLRYNGGGYLAIASEVAYMIAGSTNTSGKHFESLVFNNYPSTVNPVTGGTNSPTPFYSSPYFFPSATTLPSLNLNRVFVITGAGTCSASESIINGLRGANVQVIQIGSTTCGKPYGFYPQDNCSTTYFSIEFQGVNNLGFGSYADGFSPAYPAGNPGVLLPGCSIKDDFGHALGDTAENRLAATLYYRANQTCSSALSSSQAQIQSVVDGIDLSNVDGVMNKGPWRENRIMTH